MQLPGKVAVVTGISKGIGKAITQKLLEQDVKVAGWGRHQPGYEHDHLAFFETDVSDYQQVGNAWEQTKDTFGEAVHILVNNAGVGYNGRLETMDTERWHKMFDINVHGLYYATRMVLPRMKEQEQGHILNVSSIAGTTGVPEMAGYCGTKHAVRGISHALFKEVRAYNIKVSCLYPGSTKTNFFDNIEGYETGDFMMDPADVAQTMLNALHTPDNFFVVDWEMRPLKTPKHKK